MNKPDLRLVHKNNLLKTTISKTNRQKKRLGLPISKTTTQKQTKQALHD
jgi:hypothetical protein